MDILIKIEMLLILTTFTGSVFYGIWYLFSKISEKYHIVAYIYYALKVVIFLFIVPVTYFSIRIRQRSQGAWEGKFTESTPWIKNIAVCVFMMWCLGMTITAYAIVRKRVDERKQIEQCRKASAELQNMAEKMGKEMGVIRKIIIYIMPENYSPAVSGCFFPKIYLGQRNTNIQDLRMIFRHELMHLKNNDTVFITMLMFMRVIYWFNPIFSLNWMKKQYSSWSESYCDVCVCKIEDKKEYIKTLLSITICIAEERRCFALGMGTKMSEVRKRIIAMENENRKTIAKKGILYGWMILSFLIGGSTVYAASCGVVNEYDKLYDLTVLEEQEDYIETAAQEFVEYPDEKNLLVEEETGDVIEPRANGNVYIDWTVKPNIRKITSGFKVEKGKEIYISVSVTPSNKTVKVGVKDEDSVCHYITGKGNITYRFKTTKKGTYKIYIENNNKVNVTAAGYYTK